MLALFYLLPRPVLDNDREQPCNLFNTGLMRSKPSAVSPFAQTHPDLRPQIVFHPP